MAHSCARMVTGQVSCFPLMRTDIQLGSACITSTVPALKHVANVYTSARGANERAWWTSQKRTLAVVCEGFTETSSLGNATPQQKGAPSSARQRVWREASSVVLAGACFLCAGAAMAAPAIVAPEDCAALLPAEQALDNFGIMADSNTVVVVASVLEAVALIGAVVGGVIARNRKDETDRLNQQLRQINLRLRKQARMESYAPGLSYAPASVVAGRPPLPEAPAPANGASHEQAELVKRLKTGKKWLREQRPALAMDEFKIALGLARRAEDPVCEKKAARGLGASCQRLGRYKEAIGYHQIVLKTSKRAGDSSGDTEAFGAIADCFTELGDLEKAGKYYDQYIARLQSNESADVDI